MKEGDARWGERPEREGRIEELVDGQNPDFKAPPRSKRGGSKEDVRRGATARGEMEKGGCVRVIKGEEVRRDDLVEYFLSARVRSISGVSEEVMAIEFPKNEEISGGGTNGGREEIGSAIRWGGTNTRAYTLRNDTEEELLREMLTPT